MRACLLLSQSAVTAGVAASRGVVEKDAHHEEAVLGAGEIFIPLPAVESLHGVLVSSQLEYFKILLSGQQKWCFTTIALIIS